MPTPDSNQAARPGQPNQGAGLRGERRVLTVLFCDVVNSTAIAEKLDPEDWTEIIHGAFQHLSAPILRYEGNVAKLMGDAVLAFFGAPAAHEDDPERAVRAALDMLASFRGFIRHIATTSAASCVAPPTELIPDVKPGPRALPGAGRSAPEMHLYRERRRTRELRGEI